MCGIANGYWFHLGLLSLQVTGLNNSDGQLVPVHLDGTFTIGSNDQMTFRCVGFAAGAFRRHFNTTIAELTRLDHVSLTVVVVMCANCSMEIRIKDFHGVTFLQLPALLPCL